MPVDAALLATCGCTEVLVMLIIVSFQRRDHRQSAHGVARHFVCRISLISQMSHYVRVRIRHM